MVVGGVCVNDLFGCVCVCCDCFIAARIGPNVALDTGIASVCACWSLFVRLLKHVADYESHARETTWKKVSDMMFVCVYVWSKVGKKTYIVLLM